MVIADWFSGLDGHWLTPEWLVREHAILYSFSYLAVASFLIMTVCMIVVNGWNTLLFVCFIEV